MTGEEHLKLRELAQLAMDAATPSMAAVPDPRRLWELATWLDRWLDRTPPSDAPPPVLEISG